MKIEFLNGERQGESLEFDLPQITIGRDDNNDLVLQTGGVSRVHARMYKVGDSWFICDLNSTNGVKIDDFPISGDRILCSGNTVTIGEQKFVIKSLDVVHAVKFETVAPTAAVPVPEAPVSAEEAPKFDDRLLEKLKAGGGNLFQRSGADTASSDEPSGNAAVKSANPRRGIFNVIFYSAIAIIVVMVFVMISSNKNNAEKVKPGQTEKKEYFAFYYERTENDPDAKNAFNFRVGIENDVLELRIDDIQGQRHMSSRVKLKNHQTEFDAFYQRVIQSNVFTSKSSRELDSAVPEGDCSRLTVVSGAKFFSDICHNDNIPMEFSKCRDAVESLLVNLGYPTIFLTRREVEDDALKQLKDAESKFANYTGDLSYLRDAAKSYRNAVRSLEQFTPPHSKLQEAREGLDKVNLVRRRELRQYVNKFNMARNRDDVNAMIDCCNSIRELAEPDSKIYKDVSEQLMIVQRRQREKGNRR